MEGFEQSAAALLRVLSLVTEVGKDLHHQAAGLAAAPRAQPRAAEALAILETLISELRDTQASAFDLHRAVQDPDRPSKFIAPSELTGDPWKGGAGWVRAHSDGERP